MLIKNKTQTAVITLRTYAFLYQLDPYTNRILDPINLKVTVTADYDKNYLSNSDHTPALITFEMDHFCQSVSFFKKIYYFPLFLDMRLTVD